jgi:hypothetical protein
MEVLRQGSRSLVGYERLALSPAKGGFGLHHLPLVLQGPRAELWRRFLFAPGTEALALHPLRQHIHRLAPRATPVPRNPYTGTRLYDWQWQWQTALVSTPQADYVRRLLPPSWDYVPRSQARSDALLLDSPAAFSGFARRLEHERGTVIVPSRWSCLERSPDQWQAWWNRLHELVTFHPVEADTAHLSPWGRLQPSSTLSTAAPPLRMPTGDTAGSAPCVCWGWSLHGICSRNVLS